MLYDYQKMLGNLVMALLASLGLLIALLTTNTQSMPMNISVITYRFTSCGQTGRTGPSYQMCRDEYNNTNILNNLFYFDIINAGVEEFRGAQGFAIPTTGRYNITLAGAAGGRGVCNIDYGRGLKWKGQASFTAGEELLILIGQKGESPCKSVPEIKENVCFNRPQNLSDVLECNGTWYNWLSTVVDAGQLQRAYKYTGGGGGGGASMIRFVNHSSMEAAQFPIAVASGGGGSAVNASYDVIDQIQLDFNVTIAVNGTLREKYRYFMDAKHDLLDKPVDPTGFGVRGFIATSSEPGFRAGSGGGYFALRSSANIDGGILNARENFAEGGFDCARQVFDLESIDFENLHGGFGGGGGQCGGGGSGGGFSGGGVFGTTSDLPGQGGYFYIAGSATRDTTQSSYNVTEVSFSTNEIDDGYVEIVLENCGCSGECRVNTDNETFECFCPDNDTTLALNGFDCMRDVVVSVNVSDQAAVLINDVTFTPVHIEESVNLFALTGLVEIRDERIIYMSSYKANDSCCLVLLGSESQPVLASNILRESGELDVLSSVQLEADGTYVQSEFFAFLSEPVTVIGGILISKGGCSLKNMELGFTVSNVKAEEAPFESIALQDMSQQGLYSLAQSVLGLVVATPSTSTSESPTATTSTSESPTPSTSTSESPIPSTSTSESPTPTTSTSESPTPSTSTSESPTMDKSYSGIFGPNSVLVWSLTGTSAFLLLTLAIFIIGCICIRRRARKKTIDESHTSLARAQLLSTGTSSMARNIAYVAYREPALPPRLSSRTSRYAYVPTHLPLRIEHHDYEFMNYSREFPEGMPGDTPITSSAKYFAPKYGVGAPIHDFTSYNRLRVGGHNSHSWEYPRSNLIYMRELGEGQFGKVLLMRANGIANYDGILPVAVKTLSFRAPHMLEKFVEETNLMKKFCHPNIVSLLGVSSHDVNEDSAPLMILEYMPFGDLHGFLKNNKPRPDLIVQLIGPVHFFSIGRDVVEALSFLASQGYVHRDVAARNCLVGPDLHIKIADFGLSRAVQTKSYYRVEGKSVLPIRWMAPESLLYGVFSIASDIWSFGVLMWEVVTYGELPLEDKDTEEVLRMADSKTLFHPRPVNCPDEIHEVMCRCHEHETTDRIGYDEIATTFSKENIQHHFEESVQI